MRLSIQQYAQALLELEKEGNTTEIASRFSEWLSRRGEGKKMTKIVKEAERMVREESGIVDVIIETASEADTATKDTLRSKAETLFAKKKIQALFVTDKDLIGGSKIRSESVLYDESIASSLRALRKTLLR